MAQAPLFNPELADESGLVAVGGDLEPGAAEPRAGQGQPLTLLSQQCVAGDVTAVELQDRVGVAAVRHVAVAGVDGEPGCVEVDQER